MAYAEAKRRKNMKLIKFSADHFVSLSFLAAILIGGIFLRIPFSSHGEIRWIDAIFMSTSAVCVTGLSVIDVGKDLTGIGQGILLLLMQIGGLGIMTFSLFISLFLKVRTSWTSRFAVTSLSKKIDKSNLLRALSFVFVLTIIFESVGAVLLFLRFREIHPLPMAIFSSVFHSVAAFCNSGLSLYSDNLMQFKNDTYVPSVIMVLIVFGGLGFIVINELYDWAVSLKTKNRFHFSLHSKMCLWGTGVLISLGALVMLLFEDHNALAGLSLSGKVVNSLFLSITPRTAGFNVLDTGLLTDATLFFIIMLMFIGGCPGSTAGGIKITSFITLLALIRSKLKGLAMTSIFKRKISDLNIDKSLGIFASAFILVNLSTLILLLTERMAVPHPAMKGSFLECLFETASAFGTVGLSTGITPHLSDVGKGILILLMFVGRVGSLTLTVALLSGYQKKETAFEYVEEDVMVG
jgi:trk system potassium uptake protein TrkH